MSPSPAARAAKTASGGKVFVTATMPMRAGSRADARAAAAISTRTAASRLATSARDVSAIKQPCLLQRQPDLDQREADHVGERAVDALDERRPSSLDRIAARLSLGLTARDVCRYRTRRERAKANPRHHDVGGAERTARRQQRKPRAHPMF